MKLEEQIKNDVSLINIVGNIALEDTGDLREELRPIIDRPETKGIIFNFQKVQFIDSSGIGLIVSIYKNLKQKDKKMVLSNLSAKNREIFSLTRLDQILTIVENEEEGLRILK
ncbi:MAG: STAS domain-containing protein [Deltaproteobacteria bacterium]|nr:STAS domain-containing protein [Deltaproteobacteria bacterium]